jgi:hypothetical protein
MDPEATDAFRKRLVNVALDQHRELGGLSRGDPALRAAIRGYLDDLGVRTNEPVDRYHYSAVFISWCMRKALASEAEFPTATSHWSYARRAAATSTGFIVAHPIDKFPLRPGDLLHMNRGRSITYAELSSANTGYPGESGIITTVDLQRCRAEMVIGNWPEARGTITLENEALTTIGTVVQRDTDSFICVIEVSDDSTPLRVRIG